MGLSPEAIRKRSQFQAELLGFMAGKRMAVAGGLAVGWWHARGEKTTQDYDILIDRPLHLHATYGFLDKWGLALEHSGTLLDGYARHDLQLKVDVLLADCPVFKAALDLARVRTVQGLPVAVVHPRGLAAMKVMSYVHRPFPMKKEQDRKDLRALMRNVWAPITRTQVVGLLARTEPTLIPVFKELLAGPA